MPIENTDNLLAILQRMQVLTPEEVREVQRELLPHYSDPVDLAHYLKEIEWLTEYQVRLLFTERWEELAVGLYVVLDRLGEGGVSEVFKAWDTQRGRTVALKVLRQHLTDPYAIAREFQSELQALTRLSHANIIQTYDASQVGSLHYFAMEYVEGQDLDRQVRTAGPLPIAQACDYVRQVAQGLQHAHQVGLVHRDIKPANLFLVHPPSAPAPSPGTVEGRVRGAVTASARRVPDPVVKILDWGLARLRPDVSDSADQLPIDVNAEKGMLIGTADYIAPEQARDPCLVDIRADIYSLGCTFYFLLTGQPPFRGSSLMQKLMQHQDAERPRVQEARPDVPEALDAVVQRMMAIRPEDRYAIPLLVGGALRSFLPGSGSFRLPDRANGPSRPPTALNLGPRRDV
jgi:serine/threonine-protein kinase